MRILVVDDDPAMCGLLQTVLTRAGHTVDVVQTAFGLCNRVAGRDPGRPAPDVVILDHVLPGLSGSSSLEVLARDSRARTVPVILHSSLDASILEAERTEHPNCRVVQKTGRSAPLIDAIREIERAPAEQPSA